MGILLLIAVAWYSSENDVPLGGAVFFAIITAIAGLIYSVPLAELLITVIATVVYCYLYFSLLNRLKDKMAPWLTVLFVGGVIWYAVPLIVLS